MEANELAELVEKISARVIPLEFLTSTEAAKFLRVHPATLRRMHVAGRGPRRVGGQGKHARYRLADLRAFLEAGQ